VSTDEEGTNIFSFHRSVKDGQALLKTQSVYSIAYEFRTVCIVQTGLSIQTRMKQHYRRIRLSYLTKSAVTEHNTNLGYSTLLPGTENFIEVFKYFKYLSARSPIFCDSEVKIV
jgi:hypothetical protein